MAATRRSKDLPHKAPAAAASGRATPKEEAQYLSDFLEGEDEGEWRDADFYDDLYNEEEEGVRDSNPLVFLTFSFLTECTSSRPALAWGVLLAAFVVVELICITLGSVDGPNYSSSSPKFPFLPTAQQYWVLYLSYYIPLLFDAGVRVLVLLFVVFGQENKALFARLRRDAFTQFLLSCDILSVVPFVVYVTLIKPQGNSNSPALLPEVARLALRSLELLSTGRILRLFKDAPPVAAARVALARSGRALVTPLFFFLAFTVTSGSILFFVEPCFDTKVCPWTDLLSASFFAASTVTATGYGNQVPQYEYGRFVSVLVMLTGSFLLAMPVAIIGNEYADALVEQSERERAKEREREGGDDRGGEDQPAARKSWWEQLTTTTSPPPTQPASPSFAADMAPDSPSWSAAPSSPLGPDPAVPEEPVKQQQQREREQRALLQHQELLAAIHSSPAVESHVRLSEAAASLRVACSEAWRVTPKVLDALHLLDAWTQPTIGHITATLDSKPGEYNHSPSSQNQQQQQQLQTKDKKDPEDNDASFGSGGVHQQLLHRLRSTARQLLGITEDAKAFSIVPVDASAQSVHEVLLDAKVELTNPHHPQSFRGRVWTLLHVPASSRAAWALRRFLLLCIAASVVVLFLESTPSLAGSAVGESSTYCQGVVAAYCVDKSDPALDPGCFVQSNGLATNSPLRFLCADQGCFGQGSNFGSGIGASSSCSLPLSPFQSTAELTYHYGGAPNMLTSRARLALQSAVCSRVECSGVPGTASFDTQSMWYYVEFAVSVLFTVEVLLRAWVAPSPEAFLGNALSWIDALSIVPFYAEVGFAAGSPLIDFAVLSSAPLPPYIVAFKSLKALRLLKASRYLHASKVLSETLKRIARQAAGMFGLLFLAVVLASVTLYEIEQGRECFAGDAGCAVPSALTGTLHAGDRILINAQGASSGFGSVFAALWFSLVTVTGTGLGDAVPLTYGGRVVNLALMLGGLCYAAIPITVAASTFYHILEKSHDETHRALLGERSKRSRQRVSEQRAAQRVRAAVARLEGLRRRLAELLQVMANPPRDVAAAQLVVAAPTPDTRNKSWLLAGVADLAAEAEAVAFRCRRDLYIVCFGREKHKLDLRLVLSHGISAPRGLY